MSTFFWNHTMSSWLKFESISTYMLYKWLLWNLVISKNKMYKYSTYCDFAKFQAFDIYLSHGILITTLSVMWLLSPFSCWKKLNLRSIYHLPKMQLTNGRTMAKDTGSYMSPKAVFLNNMLCRSLIRFNLVFWLTECWMFLSKMRCVCVCVCASVNIYAPNIGATQ